MIRTDRKDDKHKKVIYQNIDEMDKVVVIIPVYNVEDYLADCIDSVIKQTYKEITIILVDDGSADSSGKICDDYKEKDERIIVLHKENGGLSSARNAGIQWAINHNCGEWVCFIDSDDWVHPQYVEALLQAAKGNDSPVSICQYSECRERTFESDLFPDLSPELWPAEEAYTLRKGAPIAFAVNKFCKLSCFSDIRFPEGKYFEDLFTTYKIVLPFKTVPVVNHPLYFYYRNPNGIVHSKWTDRHLDFYEAHYEYVDYLYDHEYVSQAFFQKALEQLVFVLFDGFKKVKTLGATKTDGTPHYKVVQGYAKKALFKYAKVLTRNEKLDLLRIIHPSLFECLITLKKSL